MKIIQVLWFHNHEVSPDSLVGTGMKLTLTYGDASLTYTFVDYDGLKTVDLSTKAYETCRSGVQSLIEEDKKLVLKYNKKA